MAASDNRSPAAPPPSLNGPYRLHGRTYAFLIAFVSAVGGFLFGYDLALIGGANVYLESEFHLDKWWFGFTTASATLGCIVGPLFGGWFCDRFGRRNTLLGACLLLAVSAFFTAIPNDMITFNVFRIIGGVGVGLCSVASPMYTNEIAPARWRGGLGFMYQLAIVVGSISAALVAWELGRWLPEAVSWRWMFASEIAFIALFAIFLAMVPESPRWLAERERRDEAYVIFARIDGAEFAETELQQVEQSLSEEPGTFAELWAPGLRMALFVGLCLAFFNNYTGWSAMGGYLTRLYEMSGVSRDQALFNNVLSWAFMGVVTLIACGLIDRFGRRSLWIIASVIMIAANLWMGIVSQHQLHGSVLLFSICFCAIPHSLALGPIPWLMMSEIFPTRIRARAVSITTTFIWLIGFLAVCLFPVLADLSQKRFGSIAGVFWLSAAACVLSLLFGLTILPETRGRTLEEIAASWRRKRS